MPPKHTSIPVLIAANVIPLAGVMFWGWRVEDVVFLYWCENVVAGLCNIVAILGCVPGPDRKGRPSGWFDKIFTAVFFVPHYGAFCAVHGLLLGFFFFGPARVRESKPNPQSHPKRRGSPHSRWRLGHGLPSGGSSFFVSAKWRRGGGE